MPALEIRQDEIGQFDLAAYKARKERLATARPKPRAVPTVVVKTVFNLGGLKPRERHRLDALIYVGPIGPMLVRDLLHVASAPASAMPHEKAFPTRRVHALRILNEVCTQYGVTKLDLISDRRTANLMRPRMHAYYRLRTETTLSFPQIGRLMGGRDHTTAMHGYKKFLAQVEAGKVVVELPPSLAAE